MGKLNSLPPLGNPITKKGVVSALSKGKVPVIRPATGGTTNSDVINDLISGLESLGLVSSWTPAQLFTEGSRGAWYDPSDVSTMFQDASGTIPVAADGDPVALLKDKSGNGNHLTQLTSGSRPLYHTDGTLHWLQFDGVDDFLQLDPMAVPSDAGEYSSVAAVRFDNLGSVMIVLDGHAPAPRQIAQFLRSNAGTPETIAFDTSPSFYLDSAGALTAATDYVLSQVRLVTSLEIFVNGTGDGPAAVSGTPATGPTNFKMGASSAGTTGTNSFHSGRNYGAVLIGKVLSDDLPSLNTWLGAKAGLSL